MIWSQAVSRKRGWGGGSVTGSPLVSGTGLKSGGEGRSGFGGRI